MYSFFVCVLQFECNAEALDYRCEHKRVVFVLKCIIDVELNYLAKDSAQGGILPGPFILFLSYLLFD